jgi:hypothetical protein
MKPSHLVRIVSLLVLASTALTAQVPRQESVVPLKNWTAPLYWQPSQAERAAAGRAEPQLKFSANAVSADALTFVAITPCRLVDTRGGSFNGISPFSGPSVAAAGSITIPVQSATEASTNTAPAPCGVIPSIAEAYSFNLTVVPHAGGAVDYVSLWPAGGTQPFVSTLDDPQGAIVSNAAIVPAGTPTGGISVFNSGPAITDVIIDMNGYYAAPTDLNGNTAIGAGTLAGNTTGSQDTAVGFNALGSNTTGIQNAAEGYLALANNTTGFYNTGNGAYALWNNTTGSYNTANGDGALTSNTTGSYNTATGTTAMIFNTTGNDNTAIGQDALANNTNGNNNTATGQAALTSNTGGGNNTADGFQALTTNTTGVNNIAVGYQALQHNTIGYQNMASGYQALQANVGGLDNVAIGYVAMVANTSGNGNIAIGAQALFSNTTGGGNIAIGNSAAQSVSAGNGNNIHIGSAGASGDSSVIKIGSNQSSTYIQGIYGGSPGTPNFLVCVDSSGHLGTSGCSSTPSSRRFKEQIADMADSSSKLLQLRPVTFLYKPEYDDGSHTLQYGLIAEEVAKIYPDMVGYDKDGQPASVKYQPLTPMLLNEVQKQNVQLQKQAEAIQLQQEQNRKLEDRLAALEALLSGQTPVAGRRVGSQ